MSNFCGRPVLYEGLVFQNTKAAFQAAKYKVLFAVQIDSHGDIGSLFGDLAFASDMVVDGLQKHDCIDALQRPLLPFFHDGKGFARNSPYRCI